jgi:hypothetical protein
MDISILIRVIFLLLASFTGKVNGDEKSVSLKLNLNVSLLLYKCFSTNRTYALCVENDTIPTIVSESFSGDSFHDECHHHFLTKVLGESCEEKSATNSHTPSRAQCMFFN